MANDITNDTMPELRTAIATVANAHNELRGDVSGLTGRVRQTERAVARLEQDRSAYEIAIQSALTAYRGETVAELRRLGAQVATAAATQVASDRTADAKARAEERAADRRTARRDAQLVKVAIALVPIMVALANYASHHLDPSAPRVDAVQLERALRDMAAADGARETMPPRLDGGP